MSMDMRKARLRNQGLGLVFIILILASGWLTVAIYQHQFSSDVPVRLRADRVGNQLKVNADVKVRGMTVGTVRTIEVVNGGVDVGLSMDPDKLKQLPRNVTARLLPKTLFGQRYVSLIIPESADSTRLAEGDTIDQDTSGKAIEVEKALRDLMPVLQAVQPQKLASTLGAISQALDGRGKPLGETMVKLNGYLAAINPQMPQIETDLVKLAETLETYQDAGPAIVDALSEMSATAKTIADNRQNITDMVTTVTDASGHLAGFLKSNGDNLIGLSAASRPSLELLARYSPSFPCLFQAVNALKPDVDKALGVGTNQPGLHVTITVKPSRGPYLPGRDTPRYTAGGGPRCYQSGGAQGMTVPSSVGPNSPAESRFVGELLGAAWGVAPEEVPDWSGLLVGPLLRGAEVTLR
ncbi:phospholipid/cholesterol/gamma-HCH transport system substrate-binding protein [Actinokineospora alba]|uniref:Phospholipid/cholesterol/gamma-HCH transport system substrate-binding protein n=1 Tax=Actinokineospora alba TaxID=504798 RepID=A0A1H0USE8_9PSEU|nr:MCE family protein [Actinokineospora alba]TDP69095.1 phospholipid/cholesterol/gamma-HCH transport system substrate-binding protein [Actinokineospora alba]SDI79448.1 phospholipid/cholesterol/gamma-HCH transport system substrate-binding protein [Actinokineospora alba]SDP69060.1 phospholipid/cholesterol/gamma-HCH transport system substrate-binding protein [Actinokineospora alba]